MTSTATHTAPAESTSSSVTLTADTKRRASLATAMPSAANGQSASQVGQAPTTTSPKATKTKLPFVAPPTYYGCEHIGQLLQTNPTASKEHYAQAARVVVDPEGIVKQRCVKCGYTIRRTYLCLQCSTVHCAEHAVPHAGEKGHMFAVDSRNGLLYCFGCRDYIYEPMLEGIRVEQEVSLDGRKRRRLSDSRQSAEDMKYIDQHSSSAPCRATGLRGFLNMGSTCFMSVILQSLIHNPLIRNFYLSDGHKTKDCQQQNCMSCAMDEVFSEFFTQDKVEGFGPVNLLTTSWKCEQTLAGYQQQDAHEYLQFLLNQLHLTSTATSHAGLDDDGLQKEQDSRDCQCIIHRAFYGKLQSDVTCESCRSVTTTLDPVMDLSLDLRLKDKKKSGSGSAVGVMPAEQSLQDCLQRFTAKERLGADDYTCENCRARDATKQLTVKTLPPVLCIQLKRFEHTASGSFKLETNITFPLQLDIAPFTTKAKRKPSLVTANGDSGPTAVAGTGLSTKNCVYDLLSVVVHKGEINSGHYVSYAREGTQWFMFDDSMVTLASEKQVLQAQAYLLVYVIRTLG